jgi:hypothetical protein
VAKHTNAVLGRVVAHYESLIATVQAVNPAATFYPDRGYDVFSPDFEHSTDEVARFEIRPVKINLPLKGQSTSNDLYVVFEGRLGVDVAAAREQELIVTKSFASRAGYFTWNKHSLEHVFGVHCDLDTERLAHPAFHAQLVSFGTEFHPHVRELIDVPLGTDRMAGVLHGVRLPTAQMDFFAFIVQLAADHLMWEESGEEERKGFNELLKLDRGVKGLTLEIGPLREAAEVPCHRGPRWYAEAPTA